MAYRPSKARVVVITLAAMAVAAAGCGRPSGSTTVEPSTGNDRPPPKATKNLDTLRWNLAGGEPATLDAARIFGGSDLLVDANLCESLLSLEPGGEERPGLAEKVERPDDRSYVIHLRPGVKFFDGQPMTADDVVFSLDRVRDPETGSYWGFFMKHVKSIRATDDETVEIKLAKPDAVFDRMLATPMTQVVQKKYVERLGKRYGTPDGGVMCTGPYELDKWNKGTSITLVRNDGWWNEKKRPQHAAKVTFDFVTDDATVTSALAGGDLDGM